MFLLMEIRQGAGAVGSQVKTDKKQFSEQVLSQFQLFQQAKRANPRHQGVVRLTAGRRSSIREAPPDPDRTTPIVKSSRPGESGPEVENGAGICQRKTSDNLNRSRVFLENSWRKSALDLDPAMENCTYSFPFHRWVSPWPRGNTRWQRFCQTG